MKNRKIGHIISKGGSVKDIQRIIPKFPSNPTKETFIKMGYKESTAKQYCSLLKQNESEKVADDVENQIEVNTDNFMNLVQSDKANYDNILVDTCALTSDQGRNVIDNARQVTFIFATLEEMDKKKNTNINFLGNNIKEYISKILSSPDKYMLSRFNGYADEQYVDNILLQYLQILPKQIRPTLLTADKNLAVKAEAFELNYILVEQNVNTKQNANTKQSSNESESSSAKLNKKLGYGIYLYKKDDELYIINKGTFKFEVYRGGNKIQYAKKAEFKVEHGNVLHVYEKTKSNITEHIINI